MFKFYTATSKTVNSPMNYVKCIKSVHAQANKLLNQTLTTHIQNHLVEGSSIKMKSKFIYLMRKHSIYILISNARG